MSAEAETKVEGQSPMPQASTEDAASPASPMQQDAALASDDAHIDNEVDIEQEDSKEPEPEEGQVGQDSETARYPSVPAQVLQNVKDLKDEILSGQHPTVQAPEGGPDADEEENEERVDVVLKSFESKRDEEDAQEGQVQRNVTESDQEAKAGGKRDVESMLATEEDAPAPQEFNVAKGQAQEASERDAKRARHEQDQGAYKRASNEREKTAGNASFRKPSISDSRASRGDLHPSASGLSRSGSRTYTENSQTRPSTYNDRYLGPDSRGGRSYASDRNSVSNRSATTSHTDRLSTDSSRRDHERDRVQESRSRRDSAYERGGPPSNGRDYNRLDRDTNDRRISNGPPAPTDRDVKPALRDRISGAPPLRRPSPPVSAASNGATRYSKPPQPKPEVYGDRPPADDRRTGYKDRAPPGQRERYPSSGASAGNTPGYDRREVARTSSMPERNSDPRSFPPKNSTSYSEIRGLPGPRPSYPEQARKSPPPSSTGSRYTKPSSTYRDDEPHRSNPNVTYSRPPVPRDPLGPPPPRGSSPPPRRTYEAPAGTAPPVSSGRTYGYGPNSTVPPQSYAPGRPEFDRYAAGGPPGDAFRERERLSEYRAPPAAAPSPDRYYPASVAPPPALDPYARANYERQPPQYDRYGRPIPLEQGLPPTYASPARSAPPYIAPPVAASSVLDAELMDLKARMLELERRREAEKMVTVAVPPPRSYPNGPPELSYGGGPRGGMPSDRGYPPRERVREREREPASLYPPRNGPPPGNARDSAYGPPRNGPHDLPPPRNMPMHRGPARRSPPPLGRDERPRR